MRGLETDLKQSNKHGGLNKILCRNFVQIAGKKAGNTLFKINKKEHASPINSGLISMRGVLNIKNV
jgi:hypothetical protein